MKTLFALAPDGTPLAYDCCGSGPAVLLLHGGGGSRREWHQAGYVARLREQFTVVALDRPAMQSLKEYAASIPGSLLQVQVHAGLDHDQLFAEIDQVFPKLLAFTKQELIWPSPPNPHPSS